MMHHQHGHTTLQHRFQDENSFQPPAAAKAAPTNHKTPILPNKPLSVKKQQRRAFGDISNKKSSSHFSSSFKNNGSSSGGTTPLILKPHVSSSSTTVTVQKKKAPVVTTAAADVKRPAWKKPSNKQVNFVLPTDNSTAATKITTAATKGSTKNMDLTGLDPVENIMQRTWAEQQLSLFASAAEWERDSTVHIPFLDTDQIFANRRQARLENSNRTEQEGWELLQQEMDQVDRQDEADLEKMSREMMTNPVLMPYEDDLFDQYLLADDDDDNEPSFLNDFSF